MNKVCVAGVWLASMLVFKGACAQPVPAAATVNDSLTLKLAEAEKLFLEKNFLLLAQQYQVDASAALVKQASLWANPEVYAEANLYNPDKKRFADIGATGEKILSVSQLISLAGERNKRVKLAEKNKEMSQAEFLDLLRTLKLQLREAFFKDYYLGHISKNYSERITTLSITVKEFENQQEKGNISLKEVLRLKALLYELQSQSLDIQVQLNEQQQVLQTLLATQAKIIPSPNEAEINRYKVAPLDLQTLLTDALANRSDLLMQQKQVEWNDANYRLQKAGAYPDLHVGATYDQAGSYIRNYTGITMAFDLPVWNRNQGNIKAALFDKKTSESNLRNKTLEVQNEVLNAYRNALEAEKQVTAIDTTFSREFDKLSMAVLTNYQKQNMNLLEFIDFYESYVSSVNYLNQISATHIVYCEELNYNVGKELFK
jgi:cobalt-zinc-cadmium efflux system outer membrane protein